MRGAGVGTEPAEGQGGWRPSLCERPFSWAISLSPRVLCLASLPTLLRRRVSGTRCLRSQAGGDRRLRPDWGRAPCSLLSQGACWGLRPLYPKPPGAGTAGVAWPGVGGGPLAGGQSGDGGRRWAERAPWQDHRADPEVGPLPCPEEPGRRTFPGRCICVCTQTHGHMRMHVHGHTYTRRHTDTLTNTHSLTDAHTKPLHHPLALPLALKAWP